jgi:hypothetical protein
VWSDMDALPFTGLKTRLANYTKLCIPGSPVVAAWPPNSPRQMGEAWDAIRGMLNGHPDMEAWQDPVLVAEWEEDMLWSEELGLMKVYESVAREWEKVVDAEFVVEGSLKVVVETSLGVGEGKGRKRTGEDMEEDEEMAKTEEKMEEGKGKGKAMAIDEEKVENEDKCGTGKEGVKEKYSEGDRDEEGHRGKRRKVVQEE